MINSIPKINAGYKIIAVKPDDKNFKDYIVMGYNGKQYVTWYYNASDKGFSGGDYCESLEVAMESFNGRGI